MSKSSKVTALRPADAPASDPLFQIILKAQAVQGVLELLSAAIDKGAVKTLDYITEDGLIGVLHGAQAQLDDVIALCNGNTDADLEVAS